MPDVSIIIPVFNKLAFTRQCLDRIWRHTTDAVPYEVIVVDNGSSDGSVELLRERYPQVRVIPLSRNTGFAFAANAAACLRRMI